MMAREETYDSSPRPWIPPVAPVLAIRVAASASVSQVTPKEENQTRMHKAQRNACNVPCSGAVDKRQRDAGQATSTGRRHKLAVETLRERALHAGRLASRARRIRGQGRELAVQRLRGLAVLEGERRPPLDDGTSGDQTNEREEGKENSADELHDGVVR